MTESDWDVCSNPIQMLFYLFDAGRLPERRNRLISVACCDRVHQYLEEPSRRAVRVIERLADGEATEQERAIAEAEALEVSGRLANPPGGQPSGPEPYAAGAVVYLAASREDEASWAPFRQFIAEQVIQSVVMAEDWASYEAVLERIPHGDLWARPALSYLLRDVFGNPFRLMMLEESCLGPEVDSIARRIYDDRAFEGMGVLADALEEAGRTQAEILEHLRGPGPHVRGCWALDLILGKR